MKIRESRVLVMVSLAGKAIGINPVVGMRQSMMWRMISEYC